jgi:hypothetical protein
MMSSTAPELQSSASPALGACNGASTTSDSMHASSCTDAFIACDAIPFTSRTFGASDRRSPPELRAMSRLRTLLEYHEHHLKMRMPVLRWIEHLGHLQRLTRLGAYAYTFGHPTAELSAIEFAAQSIEKSMRYRVPGHPLTPLDAGVHALLSDAIERVTPLEEELLERGAHTPILLNDIGRIHLSFAKRVEYAAFLRDLENTGKADRFLFNMVLLRGMEAARRFNVTENGLLHSGAIDFLNQLKAHDANNELQPLATLAEQYRMLRNFLENIATMEPASRIVGSIKFTDIVERQMLGLYTFMPVLCEKLSQDAEALDLPELAEVLKYRAAHDGHMAAKLGLPMMR